MKKFKLAALATASIAIFSTSAFAVDLSQAVVVPDTYATELVTAGATALKGSNVITALGFGVSATQTRYIRYDFTNAKFGVGGVVLGDLVVPAGTAVVVSQGGAAGDSFVIFQITAPAAGIAQNAPVQFNLNTGGLVPAAKAPIDATYRLYETAAAAATGGTGGQLATDSGTIIVFDSGVKLTATPTTTTVDVASSPTYTKFLANPPVPTAVLAEIGKVSLGTGGALDPLGAPVTLPQILGAGTAITLNGTDVSAALAAPAGLTLNAAGCNAAVTIAGTSRTATGANFVLPPPVAPIVNASLCFEVSGTNTTPIAAQSFTADILPGPVANVPTPDIPAVGAGTFVRNGLVLKAAFAETTNAAGVSTAVSLNNLTNTPAPYTVRCLLNNGSAAGTPGTIPANTAMRMGLSNSLGCTANGTLRGVEITFSKTPGSVIGSVVRQNTSTGQASFDSMTGNQ